MRQPIGLVMLGAMLALGACGGEQDEGGVTREEARELDNAAEMLDTSPDGLAVTDETDLGEGEAETGDLPVTDNAATNGN